MIRLIIVAITVIGFLILSIPILFIEWIIGKFSPRTKGNQLPAHHSGSFQIDPVGSRHKGNDHR